MSKKKIPIMLKKCVKFIKECKRDIFEIDRDIMIFMFLIWLNSPFLKKL